MCCGSGKTIYRSNCSYHGGNDINVDYMPVYAMDGGIVYKVAYDSGMGHYIAIKGSGNGKTFLTYYQHLKKDNFVSVGQAVERGQKIATSGSSGSAGTTHLHVEIVKGGNEDYRFKSQYKIAKYRVNPYDYIAGKNKGKNYFTD